MSFPRCALLWARLPAGRRAGHPAAVCSVLRARVEPVPGALGRACAVASASSSSSSASGGSKAPNTSLFVPLTVKPQGPSADGDVGAELTRPLDKSECETSEGRRGCLRGRDVAARKLHPGALETRGPLERCRRVCQCLLIALVCEPLKAWDCVLLSLEYAAQKWSFPFDCAPFGMV